MGQEPFRLVSSGECTWLECTVFNRIPWLIHAFSTRKGEKRTRWKADPSASGLTLGGDKRRFLSELGAESFRLASLRQRHSAIIYSVTSGQNSSSLRYHLSGDVSSATNSARLNPVGDALITNSTEILLSLRVADCVPVLLVDRETRAAAVVHAGWRGALNRIVEKTAGELRRVFHSSPGNLVAAIGPSIRACCYEVGEDVIEAFTSCFPHSEQFFRTDMQASAEAAAVNRRFPLFFSQAPPGHQSREHSGTYLDLAAVARFQLEQAGVPTAQIHVADYCTACRNDLFYSYRKEGSLAGRMIAVLGIRKDLSR